MANHNVYLSSAQEEILRTSGLTIPQVIRIGLGQDSSAQAPAADSVVLKRLDHIEQLLQADIVVDDISDEALRKIATNIANRLTGGE